MRKPHSRHRRLALAVAAGIGSLAITSTLAQQRRSAEPKPRPPRRPLPRAGGTAGPGAGQAGRPVLQRRRLLRALRHRQGNGSTELQFKTQQINDILKSLVLQDLDGGQGVDRHLSVAGPARQDAPQLPGRHHRQPVAGRPAQPASRGDGDREDDRRRDASAARSSASRRSRPVGDKGQAAGRRDCGAQHPGQRRRSSRSSLDDVRDIQLEDPQLHDELAKALDAVAAAREPGQEAGHDQLPRRRRAAGAHRVRRRDAGLEDELPADPRG